MPRSHSHRHQFPGLLAGGLADGTGGAAALGRVEQLLSIHSGAWDPFFAACAETGTVVCMHIGSSSKMPATSGGAPVAVAATLSFGNAMSTWPDTKQIAQDMTAGLPHDVVAKILRGNAIRMLDLDLDLDLA